MVRVWRLTKTRHAAQALSGEGARLYGGRWTGLGVRVVYTSGSLSLATLEILVHLQSDRSLPSYSSITIDIPSGLIETVDEQQLPDHWREFPAPAELRIIGEDWLRTLRSTVMKVPSAITPHEYNFLINPSHPGFRDLVIGDPAPYPLDRRFRPR